MVTVETLQAELDKYRKELAKLQANANALSGAIQAIEALIAKGKTNGGNPE